MDKFFEQRMSRDLAESLGLMLSATGDGIWDWDIICGNLYWSASLLDTLGVSKEDFSHQAIDFFSRLHPEDEKAVRETLERHLLDRAPYDLEMRVRHERGYFIPMAVRGQASWDDSGEPVRMVGTMRDLTNQESLLSTLSRVERLANIGHWHVNLDPPQLYWSAETYRIHGYEPDEISPDVEDAINLYHPDDREKIQSAVERAAVDGKRFEMRARIIHKSGDFRQVLVHGDVESDISGNTIAFFGTFQDITKEILQEERLRKSSELETIGRLVGGVAHDFNNLLSVMYGNLELLGDNVIGTENQCFVDATLLAAERGASLTRQLLSFGRRALLQPRKVIVAEALLEAESMIRRVLPENISVSIDSRATIEDLVVDPDQLQSSILNIAINARDAMPDGGRLKIETYDQDVGEHIVQSDSGDLEPGRYLAISVSDTGIGMEASTRDKSIEPFFTTKSVGEGSGLGLSMVHGFTRQSEGALEISSELGSGTSVIMLFPVVLGDTFECEKMDALPSESHGGRILVAEDEVAVLAVLEGILKAAGYDVVSATSGDAAKALFEANPTFDLLVTDIVMPGSLQGTKLSKELRAIKDELPVVFMSGYAAEATVHGNGLRPEDTRLMKPVKRRDLLEAISRALRN